MNIHKKIVLLVLTLTLYTTALRAQVTQVNFNPNGTVNISSIDSIPQGATPETNQGDLNTLSQSRTTFIAAIKAYLDTAIARLRNDNLPDSKLYDAVCLSKNPARSVLVSELQFIRTKLDSNPYNTDNGTLAYFLDLHRSLTTVLGRIDTPYAHAYTDKGDFALLKFSVFQPVSFFMVDYYNKVIHTEGYKDLKGTDPAVFKKEKEALSAIAGQVNQQLAALREGTNPEILETAYSLRGEYRQSIAGISIVKLLGQPLSGKWLWLTGGQPTINPIDAIVASVKSEETPNPKASVYDRYIDSLIEKYMRYDTAGKIEDFKALLNEKNNGGNIYLPSMSTRILNTTVLENIQKTSVTLNEVRIPYLADENLYRRYDATAERSKISEEQLASLPNTGKYIITIHNLAKGEKGNLAVTQKDTLKGDRSGTQIVLDDAADQVKNAITLALPARPLTDLLHLFTGVTKFTTTLIPPGDKSTQELINKGFMSTYKDVIKLYRYNFLSGTTVIEEKLAEAGENHRKNITKSDDEAFEDFHRLLFLYINTVVGPATIRSLQEDSLLLSRYIDAAENTTLKVYELAAKPDETPVYHSEIFSTDEVDQAFKLKYSLDKIANKKDTTNLAKFSFRTGKRYRFMISAGIAYTIGEEYYLNTVTVNNGKLNVERKNEPFKLMIAGHIYPFHKGVFMQDKSFMGKGKDMLSRINLTVGIAIPKPLENFYLGAGYDFGPGIHLTGGCHFFAFRNYKIHNDQIEQERVGYRPAPFVALSIDPTTLVKVFNIFNH